MPDRFHLELDKIRRAAVMFPGTVQHGNHLPKGEQAVNNLFDQYVMLKNAIREMGGYEADEEID